MILTPNMSLVLWNNGQDPYDSSQLASNFNRVDQHDHTPGKGNLIGTGAIAQGAITPDKLAPGITIPPGNIPSNSLTGAQLQANTIAGSNLIPGTITAAQIQNNTITSQQIAPNAGITSSQLIPGLVPPIGAIFLWGTTTAPSGYLFLQGQTLLIASYTALYTLWGTQFNVGNEGVNFFRVPDLCGRVAIGAGGSSPSSPSSGNTTTTRNMGDGMVAHIGEETHLLQVAESGSGAHTHTITDPGHTHTDSGHTHSFSATTGSESAHTHAVSGTSGTTSINHQHGATNTFVMGGSGSQYMVATVSANGPYHTQANDSATDVPHNHSFSATTSSNSGHTHSVSGTSGSGTSTLSTATTGIAINQAAGVAAAAAHNTMQPSIALNFIVKYQ